MQKANYWRGAITNAKGDVAKWTNIEASFREKMQEAKADSAKRNVLKSIERLKEVRKTFSEIKFPENEPPVNNNSSIQK